MKLLAWAVLILLVLWALRSNKSESAGRSPANNRPPKDAGIEAMVQCAHCGIYIPVSEAVAAASGASYCSEEHRLRHAS